MAVSNTITGVLNFAAMVLSVLIIGSGIWLASKQDTECVKFFRWPLITIGVVLLLVSAAGFVGALWRVPYLLVIYLIFMFVFIIALLALVIFAFVITNKGRGHAVAGRNYDEYQLNDFSGWLRHYVENTKHWNKIKSCLSSSKMCSRLDQRYPGAQYLFNAHLTPLEKREEDTVHMEQKGEENTVHSLPSSSCHDLGHFKQFDSVKDPMDHFYHQETNQHINKRNWMKKVQQEWNILQENLPDTIFVRIYEDRMDLLRAVIVGAAGTPYQDGLFFSDIHFPSQYPDVPPLVHYHSGGLSLNPNLYDTGKVCLSLLNTWTGRGNEVWNPSLSNVLQVLVSIQGLVLNANPYFNEPEYDKQFGSAKGEKDSLAYKENSFLLSCKSMLYILRSPPKHFEMFVKEHFQKRGHWILRACDAYVKGAQVGLLSEDCRLPSNVEAECDNKSTTSAGFKLMLLKIVPKLISAFSEIGVDCQAFQESIAKESKGLGGL